MIFSAGVHIIHASYPHHLSNFMAHDVIQSCFHIHRKYYILTDIYIQLKKYKVLIGGVKILIHNTCVQVWYQGIVKATVSGVLEDQNYPYGSIINGEKKKC